MPVGLIRVWEASTNTPWALKCLMGNPSPVRVEGGWKCLLLLLLQKPSADTVCKQTVGVCLCMQLHQLPVYIGMFVDNYLGPVILKRWSLSLPAFLMDAIIFLAELGAGQTLWGPRPCNDTYLTKQHKHWAGDRQEIKALCKCCKWPKM